MNFRFKYTLKNINKIIILLIFTLFLGIVLSFINLNLKKNMDMYYLLSLVMHMV